MVCRLRKRRNAPRYSALQAHIAAVARMERQRNPGRQKIPHCAPLHTGYGSLRGNERRGGADFAGRVSRRRNPPRKWPLQEAAEYASHFSPTGSHVWHVFGDQVTASHSIFQSKNLLAHAARYPLIREAQNLWSTIDRAVEQQVYPRRLRASRM